jgi:hypothetical protein
VICAVVFHKARYRFHTHTNDNSTNTMSSEQGHAAGGEVPHNGPQDGNHDPLSSSHHAANGASGHDSSAAAAAWGGAAGGGAYGAAAAAAHHAAAPPPLPPPPPGDGPNFEQQQQQPDQQQPRKRRHVWGPPAKGDYPTLEELAKRKKKRSRWESADGAADGGPDAIAAQAQALVPYKGSGSVAGSGALIIPGQLPVEVEVAGTKVRCVLELEGVCAYVSCLMKECRLHLFSRCCCCCCCCCALTREMSSSVPTQPPSQT